MELTSIWSTISALFSITIINIALSGDNAAVIALAVKDLPLAHRKMASIIGCGGAVILRVIFTIIATILIKIPYLNAIGGLLLFWITWNLLKHQDEDADAIKSKDNLRGAVWTIILADVSMSFDNVMGVAGAAGGNIPLVVFGLLLSIPIIVLGSNWLAIWMNRIPYLIYIGAAVLAHTAAAMFFHDKGLHLAELFGVAWEYIIPWGLAIAVLIWGWFKAKKIVAERATGVCESESEN